MAQLHRLVGQVEVNCSADRMFEVVMAKQRDIPNCSDNVQSIQAQHGDWVTPGTTRTWEFNIDGKTQALTDRIEEVDKQNRTVLRRWFGGDLLKDYSSFTTYTEAIPKGNNSCIMKLSLEYQKVTEDAPEPHKVLEFSMNVFKEIECHLGKAKEGTPPL